MEGMVNLVQVEAEEEVQTLVLAEVVEETEDTD
jgi:hypothetical protein